METQRQGNAHIAQADDPDARLALVQQGHEILQRRTGGLRRRMFVHG